MRSLLVSLVLLCLLPAAPGAVARVCAPAGDVVAAARSALAQRASADGVTVEATPAAVDEVCLPSTRIDGMRAEALSENWLRPRIAVPVSVAGEGGVQTRVAVWFAVRAPQDAWVYESNAAKGAPAEGLRLRRATVDAARAFGRPLAQDADALAGLRLRRAVRAGAPVLQGDFEALPAVRTQQSVQLQSGVGAVRLSVKAKALADGAVGDVISVLPMHASRPLRARVVSSEVVTLEN